MTGSDLFADILQPAGAVTNNQSKPKEQTHLNLNSDNLKLFNFSYYCTLIRILLFNSLKESFT